METSPISFGHRVVENITDHDKEQILTQLAHQYQISINHKTCQLFRHNHLRNLRQEHLVSTHSFCLKSWLFYRHFFWRFVNFFWRFFQNQKVTIKKGLMPTRPFYNNLEPDWVRCLLLIKEWNNPPVNLVHFSQKSAIWAQACWEGYERHSKEEVVHLWVGIGLLAPW